MHYFKVITVETGVQSKTFETKPSCENLQSELYIKAHENCSKRTLEEQL